MNNHQIALVRNSHALVQSITNETAALFYDNLFDADPSLRHLFKGDMSRQGKLLMDMIGAAVKLLDRPATLVPVLRHLGARHAGYGVRRAHYDTVGAALLKTLEHGLGAAFTPAVKDAWNALYGLVARTMLEGSVEPALG